MKPKRLTGIQDVVTELNQHDIALVLPTPKHADYLWPIYLMATMAHHPANHCAESKTAIVLKCIHKAMRLWVPYAIGSPLDATRYRGGFVLVSPYFTGKELEQWTV